MTILFYGDPHGEFKPLIQAVETHAPQAVIILGDLQCQRPLQEVLQSILHLTDIWFIHGNHDTDSEQDYSNLFHSELAHKNLHGRVETIAGVKIAGLGGVFRGEIWYPKSESGQPTFKSRKQYKQANAFSKKKLGESDGVPRVHHSSIWYEDFEKLLSHRAEILVTHEAPSCHRYGFNSIDLLAQNLRVNKIFHGHHHQNYDDEISCKTGVISVHGIANVGIKTVDGIQL